MLGWKCSRVPAGGCERRVPAGERSDPAGSSSAQPGLAEAERQQRGRLGWKRERRVRRTARQQCLAMVERCYYNRDQETSARGDRKIWSWIRAGCGKRLKLLEKFDKPCVINQGHVYFTSGCCHLC